MGLLVDPLVIRAPATQAYTAVSSHASSFRTRLQTKQLQLVPDRLDGSSANASDDGAAALSNAFEPGTFHQNHQVAQIWNQLRSPTSPKPRGKAEDYALTEELLRAHARNGTIIAAMSNAGHLDFVLNWAAHLMALNVTSFVVGALDSDMLWEMVDRGIPTFSLEAGLDKGDWGWGGQAFIAAGRSRQKIMEIICSLGFSVLMSDVDLVWLRDPLPYMAQWPAADLLVSSDSVVTTAEGEGLESASMVLQGNVGVVLARPSALAFLQEWGDMMAADPKLWEQAAFNDLVHRGGSIPDNDYPDLFRGYDQGLSIGTLPVGLFCNGHTNFVQQLPETLGLEPFSLHAIYQYSAEAGKRHRFRESLAWNDPEEYYDPPGGFVTYEPNVSRLLATAAPAPGSLQLDNFAGHFDLVNHQLKELRHALAIASALERVLIVPPMWCGADRYWAPHDGRIFPSQLPALPFICPLDHVLDLEAMQKKQPEIVFGPHIHFREYSLLDNPRMPLAVKQNELQIRTCQDDSNQPECASLTADSHVQTYAQDVWLTPNLTDAQLLETLQPYAGEKILRFHDVVGAFGGHKNPQDADRFERRTKSYTSLWMLGSLSLGPDAAKHHNIRRTSHLCSSITHAAEKTLASQQH
ncbi:hypothetical protein WJX84_001335 [Apatococcus fuscideae]